MKKSVLSFMMVVAIITASFAQEKRYGIESAILKKNTVVNAQGVEQTFSAIQYIADYGMKQSTEMFMDMQGQTHTIFNMNKDGYLYSANMSLKQGTKVKMPDGYDESNSLSILNEMKEKFQIEAVDEIENGNVQFLGKECKSYELTFNIQGQTMKTTRLVWQGMTLKTSMSFFGISTVEEVTEILEGVEIANEKFELPEGINFIERNPLSYQPEIEHVLKGATAPDFTLPNLSGELISLSSLKGKYIVLDFYTVGAYPTKFILDKDLKIVAIFQGEVKDFYIKLEQLID